MLRKEEFKKQYQTGNIILPLKRGHKSFCRRTMSPKKQLTELIGKIKEEVTQNEKALQYLTQLETLLLSEMQEKSGQAKARREKKKDTSENFSLPPDFNLEEGVLALFADGACRGNPGPGAWGAFGQERDGQIFFKETSVNLKTTNNRMELEGAICALIRGREKLEQDFGSKVGASKKIFLYSDSKYVLDGIKSWMPSWKKNSWLKADKTPPMNIDLWKELDVITEWFLSLKLVWVKGHNGHPQNEYCDEMANKALDDSGY
jgi:ribonuclease HI